MPPSTVAESPPPPVPSSPDPEAYWLAHVWQRGARQLTVRAVISGMLLGALLCLSNLYVVLKTGWSMGVTITACILAFAVFRTLGAVGLTRTPFTVLENNAMSSVASAAGYMTGGGNMAAVPALLVLTGSRPDGWALFAWFASIALLGVFAAIPIKRQLINIEQVAFPTGTATAATLRSLHPHADADAATAGEGSRQARWLLTAGAFAALFKITWHFSKLPSVLPIFGATAAKWTLGLEGSLVLLGGGALMSWRTGWTLLVGALLTYGVLAPELLDQGLVAGPKFKQVVQWTLWPAAAMLVASGLLQFAMQWRSVARAFSGLWVSLRRGGGGNDPMAAVESPAWWFPAGFLVVGPVVVWLGYSMFGIPIWAGLIALPLAVLMGVVAARVTGETDVTPTKALGPVTQLTFGAMLPGNLTANLMSANITGGVGLHAADLLTDLKSGYLLGANPRQQVVAQLFGVFAGAAAVVPAFALLVPTADVIGSAEFPAPAVQVWAGVSKVLAAGASGLHPTMRWAAAIGALVGILLTLLEKYAPAKVQPFVPSPAGLGIAMCIPGYNAVAMGLGAGVAEVVRRRTGKRGGGLVMAVGSGFIAGESLMGVALAILIATGVLAA